MVTWTTYGTWLQGTNEDMSKMKKYWTATNTFIVCAKNFKSQATILRQLFEKKLFLLALKG